MAESTEENLSLRQALDTARMEYQRLEDELELWKLEKQQMSEQIRTINKSLLDSQTLAESEVRPFPHLPLISYRANGSLARIAD